MLIAGYIKCPLNKAFGLVGYFKQRGNSYKQAAKLSKINLKFTSVKSNI